MYEHLLGHEKVPRGCNYRDKFEGCIVKHVDYLKVSAAMSSGGGDSTDSLSHLLHGVL